MSRAPRSLQRFFALSALAAMFWVQGCSKGGAPDNSGKLTVALVAPGGYTINTVSYEVDAAGGAVIRSGTVDVSGPGANLSFALDLPAATGDTITLTATSTTGVIFTGTSPPFNVVSGQTTLVSVTLTNTISGAGGAPGQIQVTGTIVPANNPPSITFLIVSPLQVAVGTPIDVTVTAADADGDALTYLWTASPDGAFAAPSSAATTFSSSTAGTKTLTITVSDVHGATAVASVPVTIISLGTGGGGTTGAAGSPATGGTTGAAGSPGTGGAPATGGSTGSGGTGDGGAALQAAELATGFDPNLLTFTHSTDPDTGDQTPIGWGPSTLPSPAQQQASAALIRAIAAGLPGSVRNSTNTANAVPGTPTSPSANIPNPPNGLLTLGTDPQSLISGSGIGTDAATVALLQAYANAAIADAAVAKDANDPGGLTAAQAASNATLGGYIAAESSDPSSAIGLAVNIVTDAVQYGLVAQLQAF
ncbi:MAG TPA: hypothetical protein VMT03_27075 [Polyangia bacterium]|nr:hypothetical protein [Polyangia bacterium]